MTQPPLINTITPELRQCQEYDVRLTSQTRTAAAGNLEICFRNRWHLICSNLFNMNVDNLNVVCRSLGFAAYENSNVVQHRFTVTQLHTSGPPFLHTLHCLGKEDHLSHCHRNESMSDICNNLSIECLG